MTDDTEFRLQACSLRAAGAFAALLSADASVVVSAAEYARFLLPDAAIEYWPALVDLPSGLFDLFVTQAREAEFVIDGVTNAPILNLTAFLTARLPTADGGGDLRTAYPEPMRDAVRYLAWDWYASRDLFVDWEHGPVPLTRAAALLITAHLEMTLDRTGSVLWHDLDRFERACASLNQGWVAERVTELRSLVAAAQLRRTRQILRRVLAQAVLPLFVSTAIAAITVGTLQDALGAFSFLISDGILVIPVFAVTNRLGRAAREANVFSFPQRQAVPTAGLLSLLATAAPLVSGIVIGDRLDWTWYLAGVFNWLMTGLLVWAVVGETRAIDLFDLLKVQIPGDPNF